MLLCTSCAPAVPQRLPISLQILPVWGACMHAHAVLTPPSRMRPMQCPMIARKFPRESAQALVRVLSDCRNQLSILVGPKCNADF